MRAYLVERWLPTRESQLAPSTFESYRHNVRHHIVPRIGSAHLQGFSADVLTRFYGERLASGLSARTVRYLHSIIRKSLADALSWGLVVRNVADAASPPSNRAAKGARADHLVSVGALDLTRLGPRSAARTAVARVCDHRPAAW